ncbi:MAG: DUF2085 domain-containing protein [Ignavibacteriales bacterium]|nr:DUF2085 domain-containing protein [Ignavibacteriales bacterium]
MTFKHKFRSNISIKLFFFFLISIWCIGFILPIYYPQLYPALNLIYRNVCHQNSAKTIFVGKTHLLVCSRCTGIYLGSMISLFLLLFVSNFKLQTKFFFLASVPIILDVFSYSVGIYNYSLTIAFITGFVFGSAGIIYIWSGIEKLLTELNTRDNIE